MTVLSQHTISTPVLNAQRAGAVEGQDQHTAKKIKCLYTRICQQPHQAFFFPSFHACSLKRERLSLQMLGVSREQLLYYSAKVQCRRPFLLAILQSSRQEQVKATKDCDCRKEPTHYCYQGCLAAAEYRHVC